MMVKLFIVLITAVIVLIPSKISSGPTAQSRVEQLISKFLNSKGSYMAIYFSDIDTAFTTIDDDSMYQQLSKKVSAYQDSTVQFSHTDFAKANIYFDIYKKLNLKKDSTRINYQPRPLGYLILHHFQFDGKPWTDSFTVDFNFNRILKVKETIE